MKKANKTPYNILFVESGLTGGGSFESLYQYLKKIDRSKYSPHVVFLNHTKYYLLLEKLKVPCFLIKDPVYSYDFNKTEPFLNKLIARIKLLSDLYFPFISLWMDKVCHYRTIKKLIEIIRKENIHIVHANNQVNRDLYVVESARKTNIPCIIHLRSFFSMGFNTKKADYANTHVKRYIAYSKSIADHWTQKGINSEKISIVYNAIDKIKNKKQVNLHELFKIPLESKIIGIVGKMIPVRGYDFLFKTFARLNKSRTDVYLLVVGGGDKDFVLEMKQAARDLNIVHNTIFTGYRLDTKEIIEALDILVLPYSIEPFGRVLLEGWILKTPIALTAVGHINKIVSDKNNCMLIKPNNQEQFLKILIELISDKGLCDNLTENGYKTVRKLFSIEQYCEKVHTVYTDALN